MLDEYTLSSPSEQTAVKSMDDERIIAADRLNVHGTFILGRPRLNKQIILVWTRLKVKNSELLLLRLPVRNRSTKSANLECIKNIDIDNRPGKAVHAVDATRTMGLSKM